MGHAVCHGTVPLGRSSKLACSSCACSSRKSSSTRPTCSHEYHSHPLVTLGQQTQLCLVRMVHSL
jgi:hypothetical protein